MATTQLERFRAGLRLELTLDRVGVEHAARVAQLEQHTTAFNLCPSGRSEEEWREAIASRSVDAWLVTGKDRFDDYGAAGVLAVAVQGKTLRVETFLLSCRVLGKGAEERLLETLVEFANERGCEEIQLCYRSSGGNGLARAFVSGIGPALQENDELRCSVPVAAISAVTRRAPVSTRGERRTNDRSTSVSAFLAARWSGISPRERATILLDLAVGLRREEQLLEAVASHRRVTRTDGNATFVAPRTPLEEVIATIWSEVLAVDRVGIHDHFFQLGGHSLLVAQVISRLHEALNVRILLQDVFKTPTVATLAAALSADKAAGRKLNDTSKMLLSISRMSDDDAETALSQRLPRSRS